LKKLGGSGRKRKVGEGRHEGCRGGPRLVQVQERKGELPRASRRYSFPRETGLEKNTQKRGGRLGIKLKRPIGKKKRGLGRGKVGYENQKREVGGGGWSK